MYNQKEVDLLPQGDRTSSDGREGTIVPGPLPSSSNDGPTSGCTAGLLAEEASAKTKAEENRKAGLPIILIPPIDKEMKRKPGPALTKRERSGPRTRSGSRSGSSSRSSSVASVASVINNAAMEIEKTRKAQRELEKDVKRYMAKAAITRAESYENMDVHSNVVLVSDDEEHGEEGDSGSDTEPMDARETNRRKRKRKRKSQRSQSLQDPKRGRPLSTGEFIGLADAKRALNEQRQEEERLDREKKIRLLAGDDLLDHLGIDMDGEIEEARHGPTADLANRAPEGLMEVLRVAKVSKNIKGDLRKVLRTVAITATAVVEILRTRADCPADSDVPRQVKALKEELGKTKAEVARVNEESKRLREELAEVRGEGGSCRRRKVYYVEDSPPSSPVRGGKEEKAVKTAATTAAAPSFIEESMETPMEIEVGVTERDGLPKYSDERRKKEILPPMEEWPAAIRPALQGRVKILEDRPLIGHKVRLEDGRKTKRAETSPTVKGTKEEKGGHKCCLSSLPLSFKSGLRRTSGPEVSPEGPTEGKRRWPRPEVNRELAQSPAKRW